MKSMLKTVATPIALLFTCRMLGLFMLIPIFTLYADDLQGSTPFLMGFALGGYGLSQALLQIPFGLWSDRYGRQRMIIIGLLMLGIGSLIGACTHHIYGIILARILQGAGAIGSVLMALLADLTTEKQRSIAMALIGSMIGLSFSIAFIISPIIAQHYGLSGIFTATIALSIIGLMIAINYLPADHFSSNPPKSAKIHFKQVIQNKKLYGFNFGIFCQHFILTALFFISPIQLNFFLKQHIFSSTWHVYLPILSLSFICMLPLVYLSEKKYDTKRILMAAVALIAVTQLCLLYDMQTAWFFVTILFLYFVSFNLLEALLPSSISKVIDSTSRGTAMGIYSSFQFLGIFCGGSTAGILYTYFSASGVLICTLIISVLWMIMIYLTLHGESRRESSLS